MENNIGSNGSFGIPIKILKLPETEYQQRKRKFGTNLTNFIQSSNAVESGFPVQQKSQNSQSLSQGC